MSWCLRKGDVVRNEVSRRDVRRAKFVSELVRGSTGLLSVLILVVLCIIGRIILRLWVVTLSASGGGGTIALLSIGLTAAAVASAAVTRCTITRRTVAIGGLLGCGDVALPYFWSSPGRNIGPACGNVMSCGPWFRAVSARPFTAFPKLGHQASVFGVEATFQRRGRGILDSVRIPVNCTVTSHMTGATTDTADNVRCEITLLGTVVLAVTNAAAVLANLVLVIAKRTVKRGEFTELIALVVILPFGSRSSLETAEALVESCASILR